MLQAFGALLACQLIGEIVARGLNIPIPGPVIGLVLLVFGLAMAERRGIISLETVDHSAVGKAANGLLGVLGILFVPAGVGVVQHLDLFAKHGVGLIAALVGSTLVTLVVTLWVFIKVAQRLAGPVA